jgi:hypothetical protein
MTSVAALIATSRWLSRRLGAPTTASLAGGGPGDAAVISPATRAYRDRTRSAGSPR